MMCVEPRLALFTTSSRKVNVSDTTQAAPKAERATRIELPRFDELIYWVDAPNGEFDGDAFRKSMPPEDAEEFVTVAPRDGASGPYSVLCAWATTTEGLSFRVTYFGVGWPPAADEHEPFAEQFMSWFGQFFKSPKVACHLHARFTFDGGTRHNTFALEMSEPLPWGATLNGVSLVLPPNPQGAESIKMTQGESEWYVEVVASREIEFTNFTPHADLHASLTVVNMFLVEHES